MTADPDQLLSDFIDAWTTGRRPDVDDFLARAPDDRRGELAARINTYLTVAPTPDYDEQTWSAIRTEALASQAIDLSHASSEAVAPLLARLRKRAGLTVDQLATTVTDDLGVTGGEDKAAGYLERLETGDLDPRGVSERLFEALGRALRSSAGALVDAARSSAPPRPSAAFFRAEPSAEAEVAHHLEVLADAMAAPAPESREWDEVDELFLEGR